jgi:hypothetical protein
MLASRSPRIEIACIALVAGCMRIYPDPELPDIDVEWPTGDCQENTIVSVSIEGLDDPTVKRSLMLRCREATTTFEDVDRQRYKLVGSVIDDVGEEHNSEWELDLRDGLNEHAYLYFGELPDFFITWEFEGGASCDSLGVVSVVIRFMIAGEQRFAHPARCDASSAAGHAPMGVYDVAARGYDMNNSPIATSSIVPNVTIVPGSFASLGTLVLAPCGAQCP